MRRGKFSNRIFQYRKRLNLSQKDLAYLLGHKDQSQVSKWESGVKIPSLASAIDLEKALCAPVSFLFPEYSRSSQEKIIPRKEKLIQQKISYEQQSLQTP